MTEQQTFDIEKLEATHLPELQGLKEKQLQIVRENPFVKVEDTTTYEVAKKARTTLVSARTDIEKQDKLIASKIKKFREAVAKASQELIAITKPHEDKQQDEVRRYEAIKEAEKAEKAKQEEERKNKIKNAIDEIFKIAFQKVDNLTFEMIDTLKVDFEQNLFQTDAQQFEEFELDFNEKLNIFKSQFSYKVKNLTEQEERRKEDERLKAERAKLEAERAELEAKQKEESAKLEAAKAQYEAAVQKERAELEAEKARLAKAESDRKAAEASAKLEAERKEREAKEEAEKEARTKAEAERREALKPEKDKAIEFADNLVFKLPLPEVQDPELLELLQDFVRNIEVYQYNFINTIKTLQ